MQSQAIPIINGGNNLPALIGSEETNNDGSPRLVNGKPEFEPGASIDLKNLASQHPEWAENMTEFSMDIYYAAPANGLTERTRYIFSGIPVK